MCPKCMCTAQIRIKYMTYFKCPTCTLTLRCGAETERVKCPKCYDSIQVDLWRGNFEKTRGARVNMSSGGGSSSQTQLNSKQQQNAAAENSPTSAAVQQPLQVQ
eukprot:CAMPEP_0197516750 /NCGR_PEP_ID=MMETSP1318-20131121/1671_1 /TAXON_ID=552666 /ORGANISM="Partenskyella glossopodia, Strain RCC365" /LENGTH=103 /DNA_ID=CAMNT_0043065737 /DNA_START=247 /DNA_END=558 /DNA_ORIENTATION=-